jgi:glycosyltransferase involved in cell wall biosynthesis
MKILVLQDYLRSGGTERQSVLLANAFAASGHTTTFVTFRPGGILAPTVNEKVRRITLQPFDTRLDWFCPGLRRTVRSTKPDLILCMGRMANCFAGRLQRALPQAAVVSTLRTGKSLPLLFRRSLGTVRHIIANSREAKYRLVHEQAIAADRISVIHNSLVFPQSGREVDPPESTSRDIWRNQQHASPGTVVLLCVAMFRPEKNQRELIEIAAGLPPAIDWQLWLVGDGPTRVGCERLVADKNLTARVKFTGLLKEPAGIYAAADIAVHASSSESLSNFLIEAQAHGLPAVAYAAQGISETFVPGRTGWEIARGARDEFRATVIKLAGDSVSSRALRAAEAKAFAHATFDPDRQVSAYLALFEQLVSARKTL